MGRRWTELCLSADQALGWLLLSRGCCPSLPWLLGFAFQGLNGWSGSSGCGLAFNVTFIHLPSEAACLPASHHFLPH